MAENFIEIEAKLGKGKRHVYRFYGRGVWRIKRGKDWQPINGIYVPGEVLKVAAAHCHPAPPPILTEIEIARLCGGRC